MIARVIYFGPDDCHRLMVLRSAGYRVADCDSLSQLRALLASVAEVDAVLISDRDGISPREAVAAVRARSPLPVILFRNSNMAYEDSGFDLVVPCLTPPEVWLNDVETLIARCRTASRPGGLPMKFAT